MKGFVAIFFFACAFAEATAFYGRITGGSAVVPHSVPHQVALFVTVPQGTAFCGGSVFSETIILTAAHCVETASEVKVVVGAHYVKTNETTTQTFVSNKFIVHEGWNMLFKHNDIALIILPEKIVFNEYVKKIELPVPGFQVPVEHPATVSGWGIIADGTQEISSELYSVTSKILDLNECNKKYFGLLDKTQVCLNGENGKSSCRGDSGGALTITIEGKLVQAGIVSFGIVFGCEIGYPGVYTNVAEYIDWINNNVQ